GYDLADRPAHETGDRTEAGKLDPLLPHRLHYVGRQTGFESGSRQRGIKHSQPRRRLAVSLTIKKVLKIGQLNNAPLIVNVGRDETDTTDDGAFSKPLRKDIEMADAIERRKNQRLWPKIGRA